MDTLILTITLLCMAIPAYVYAGYPILLFILVKTAAAKIVDKAPITPQVSLIVSCYNEVAIIREKIENCLQLDYPIEKLEIIFVSDGSDDGSDDIINEYADRGIKLIRQEGRLGKTSALNLAVPQSSGEIIVFSDANAIYEPNAISMLVRSFNDAQVGYVVGAALYTDGGESSAAASEDIYWKYEMYIKSMETKLHSVVGGDGAIYAIRSQLYDQLDARDINDFVNPLEIIAKGYRGVFDRAAICYEETSGDFGREATRKERIVNRSFRGLMKVKAVMNPFKVGLFSIEIISHKFLRWLVPFFLFGIAIGSMYLTINDYIVFHYIIILESVFLWLAIVGYYLSKRRKIPFIFFAPYYFLLVNWSSLLGVISALGGNIQVTWTTPRTSMSQQRVGIGNIGVTAVLILASMWLVNSAVMGIVS